MWIYYVVTLLLATETVANEVTFADLERITIQLPALYGCKNDTELCIWPQWRVETPYPTENHLHDGNGYKWVVLSTDGKYPALLFVYYTEDRSIIYCSSHYDGLRITCSTDDTEMIHNLTQVQVEESGDRVVIDNITSALRNESLKIVEQCKKDSSNVIHNVSETLRDESFNIADQCKKDSSNVIDSVNTLRNESFNIAEQCNNDSFNVIRALGKTAEKCEDNCSTNGIILIVLIIHCLLVLLLQVRSIWGLIKHIFKCFKHLFECLSPSRKHRVGTSGTTTPTPPVDRPQTSESQESEHKDKQETET